MDVATILQPRRRRGTYVEDENEEAEGERRGRELRRAGEQLQNLRRLMITSVTNQAPTAARAAGLAAQ